MDCKTHTKHKKVPKVNLRLRWSFAAQESALTSSLKLQATLFELRPDETPHRKVPKIEVALTRCQVFETGNWGKKWAANFARAIRSCLSEECGGSNSEGGTGL